MNLFRNQGTTNGKNKKEIETEKRIYYDFRGFQIAGRNNSFIESK